MMATAAFSFLLALSFHGNYASADSIPTNHIEVHNVNQLTLSQREALFNPSQYLSSNKKKAQHNVHIFDQFGTFIRLKYTSEREEHVKIFALKPNGLNDIKTVHCLNDNTNTINVEFADKDSATQHHHSIISHINRHSKNEYFLSGSHRWQCYNRKESKYSHILRKIQSVTIVNSTTLTFTTEHAEYTDVFKNLQVSMHTNANNDDSDDEVATGPDDDSTNRRQLLWSVSSLWDDIVDGVKAVYDLVAEGFEDMREYVRDQYKNGTGNALMDTMLFGTFYKGMLHILVHPCAPP